MLEQQKPTHNGAAAVAAPIGRAPKRRPRGRLIFSIGLAVLTIVAVVVFIAIRARSAAAISYVTVPLTRGKLVQNVTASGTVNAQNTISVGTQVSGTIQSIYVDFNSRVRTGEVLAQIDPSQFQAQLDQARAALAQAQAQLATSRHNVTGTTFSVGAAKATIASAEARVAGAQADLVLARQTLSRDRALLTHGYIAQSQFDADLDKAIAAQTALRAAQAAVLQNRAEQGQASANVLGSASSAEAAAAEIRAAEAAAEQDQLNLQRSTIVSPVNGTIVARNVSIGQTVAASFQTPTLFTIAQDLKKMEVDIAVGEPDIGNVRPRNAVKFSVLAYPNRTFSGTVSQVRVNPTTIANVVTYTVVVLVDNKQQMLLPGMTANAAITIATARNALIVPTQALTYRRRTAAASPWGATGSDVSGAVVAGSTGAIFVMRKGVPQRIPVRVTLVSGTQAAISPLRSLFAGEPIVIGDSAQGRRRSQASATNPAFGLGRIR